MYLFVTNIYNFFYMKTPWLYPLKWLKLRQKIEKKAIEINHTDTLF
ncbi:hypothetical protein CPter291_0850 [Collimonas pratensis]|uniref:Uncharacterized protein n=1 Tax=Collimonas pratensis TaxID=279113 RepID=A0ABN4MA61_9BURK|nr:hypothetical protein CPter291_0850 [Collimonas pratensis]